MALWDAVFGGFGFLLKKIVKKLTKMKTTKIILNSTSITAKND